MLEYLHVLTVFSWIPLALLAGAQPRGRTASRVLWTLTALTFVLCGYILYLDFVWSKTVVAPIRVDLLLVIPLTTVTFSAVGVWGVAQRGAVSKFAALMLLAFSIPTLVVFARGMVRSAKDLAQMNRSPAMVFEAQFRNPRTFESFFGTLDTVVDPRAGHFRADDPAGIATRVIINDRGHFWLFFRCYTKVECIYSEADLGATPLPGTFAAQGASGPPTDVVVSAWTPEGLTLTFAGSHRQTFVRAPIVFTEPSAPAAGVVFHGAFSQTRVDRDYVYLVQLWLWQSGNRWLAYYTRRNAPCGSTADFVFASAYDGTVQPGRIRFANTSGGQDTFEIAPPAPGGDRIDGDIFYNGRPLQPMALAKGSAVRSPLYESAPLTDFDVTADWLKTVSMGYSLSWKAECR